MARTIGRFDLAGPLRRAAVFTAVLAGVITLPLAVENRDALLREAQAYLPRIATANAHADRMPDAAARIDAAWKQEEARRHSL